MRMPNKIFLYNKIILSVYAVLCLIQFPASIRLNGRTLEAYLQGAVFALVAFGVPLLFALGFSAIFADWTQKPFTEFFNSKLTVIIIFCGILLALFTYFELALKF